MRWTNEHGDASPTSKVAKCETCHAVGMIRPAQNDDLPTCFTTDREGTVICDGCLGYDVSPVSPGTVLVFGS